MGQYCCYKSCKSASRSDSNVKFFSVPKPGKNNRNIEKTKAWVLAINRSNITEYTVKPHHSVCSLHFVGETGPTKDHPYPIQDLKQTVPQSKGNNESASDFFQLNKGTYITYSKNVQTNNVNKASEQAESFNEGSNSTLVDVKCKLEPIDSQSEKMDTSFLPITINSIKSELLDPEIPESALDNTPEQEIEMEELNLHELKQNVVLHHSCFIHWSIICEQDILILAKREGDIYPVKLQISPNMKVDIYIYNHLFDNEEIKNQFESEIIKSETEINSMNQLLDCLAEFDDWRPCAGIRGTMFDTFAKASFSCGYFCNISQSLRSSKCSRLFKFGYRSWCKPCGMFRNNLLTRLKRRKTLTVPANNKTNLRYLTQEQIEQRSSVYRKKNSELVRKNKALTKKL